MKWLLLLALDAGPIVDVSGGRTAVADVHTADAGSVPDYGLQVAVEADGARPGDQVWLVLSLRYDKSLAVELPETLPDGKGLAPLGAPERTPENEGESLRETLRFPFVLLAVTGVHTPAFTLRIGEDEIAVPALPLAVADAGPSAEPPDPDLEGMVVYRPGPAPWILPTIGLLIGLTLLILAMRQLLARRADVVEEEEVVVDAGADFMALVARLRARLSDDPETLRSCWFEVLSGLRIYLDRRFGLQSEKSTTEELLSALAATRIVGIPRVGLAELLNQADAVRYAAAESSREAMADLLDQVEVWVDTAEQAQRQRDRS